MAKKHISALDVEVSSEGGVLVNIGGADALPTAGTDVAGANGYATVVTAPAWICHYMHVSVETKGAIISLDGGTTDHLFIPADTGRLFMGLAIPAGAVIQGKNLLADNNYANLHISVW